MTPLEQHWRPYEPTADAPWSRRRAVHLHRRAGFAATWSELERDLAGGPQEAVTRLLQGKARLDGCPPDYETTSGMLTEAAVGSVLDRRLKAAWVYRMLFSPDPLGERLALMWHNHFATSNIKVQNLKQMHEQNDLLRKHARGGFGELLAAAVKSPAMLVWLDADKNSAMHPNENLGRELLELFTVGIGNFTEADVRDAARALTGWKVVADQFRFDPKRHGAGEKTILGRTAAFTGDDLLALVADHTATARRIAWRISRLLMGDTPVDEPAFAAIVDGLRDHEMRIDWAIETVLRSRRFFAAENINARMLGPPEYVVGVVRALECFNPPPSTLLLADWMARMGQDLFYPPNVGGWTEGRSWLSSGAIVARANFAAALVEGRLMHDAVAADPRTLAARHRPEANLLQSIDWFGELLYGGLPKEVVRSVEQEATRQASRPAGPLSSAVLILLSRPEAHLG